MAVIESSRALLLPGPQPPLSHLGATLLRHVVTAALRYALHSLGAPMPERPPVRFVELRLHLDRRRLDEALEGSPSSTRLLDALLDPAGSGDASAGALRGALFFHRLRLRARLVRRSRRPPDPGSGAGPSELWHHVRATVSGFQPALGEALLGELVAVLGRRALRGRGRPLRPCLGRQAFALVTGGEPGLESLGVADPIAGAWSESPAARAHLPGRLAELPERAEIRADPLRGEFREAYRRALNAIRGAYLRLAADAERRGLLDEVGDAFFIPFDLAADLAGDTRPAWLDRAVAANRAEYQRLLETAGPPESLTREAGDRPRHAPESWTLAPLWPLD